MANTLSYSIWFYIRADNKFGKRQEGFACIQATSCCNALDWAKKAMPLFNAIGFKFSPEHYDGDLWS